MQQDDKKKEVGCGYLVLGEAAKKFNRTRQSIFLLVKHGKIKGRKTCNRWYIQESSLKNYMENRWGRKNSKQGGVLVFDERQNEISIVNACNILCLSYNQVYHLVMKKSLSSTKKNTTFVLDKNEVLEYKEKLLSKKVG